MSDKKPPKQYRITLKAQIEREYDESDPTYKTYKDIELPPLGFANAYEPNTKAYEPRKKTQDEWAYHHWMDEVYEQQGMIFVRKYDWDRSVSTPKKIMVSDGPVAAELQPKIIDNEPLEGFKIQHMVARYRGNKLWRILDPRGFELEISSGCFEDLVMTGMVDKGQIIGPCIWKTGKMLVRV